MSLTSGEFLLIRSVFETIENFVNTTDNIDNNSNNFSEFILIFFIFYLIDSLRWIITSATGKTFIEGKNRMSVQIVAVFCVVIVSPNPSL